MASSEGVARTGGSGGAAMVAGLLLAGLLIMALASGLFFISSSAEKEKLEALGAAEHAKRVEAEQHEAEAAQRLRAVAEGGP